MNKAKKAAWDHIRRLVEGKDGPSPNDDGPWVAWDVGIVPLRLYGGRDAGKTVDWDELKRLFNVRTD